MSNTASQGGTSPEIPREEARAYRYAGVTSKAKMKRLAELGIDSDEAWSFIRRAEITDIEEIDKLISHDIRGREAERYHIAGAREVDTMIWLTSEGVDGYTADAYAAVGVETLEEMVALCAAGVNGMKAYELYRAGIRGTEKMHKFSAAAKLNGVQVDELEELFRQLDKMGALGERLKAVHVAPATTVDVLCSYFGEKIRTLLEELTDEQLKVVVTLTEDHETATEKEMLGIIYTAAS